MNAYRHAKLFRNGRSQAVRIPREFEFSGDEVIIRQEGSKLTIEPARKKRTLAELLASWEPIDDRFPDIEDGPAEPFSL